MRLKRAWTVLLLLSLSAAASARPPASVLQNPTVQDRPGDDGTALVVSWQSEMPADFEVVVIRHGDDGSTDSVGTFSTSRGEVTDIGLSRNLTYTYELTVFDPEGNTVSTTGTGGMRPVANWFARDRLGQGLIILVIFTVILWGTYRKGSVYVRPISGLKAAEEAIGRSVEMGRPILFSAGWGAQLDKPTTMAAMNIFGWLARRSASYDAQLLFPAHDAVIMAAAQESARDAAQIEGKPHWYQSDHIYYITGSQFGYAAALDGIMEREKPAANFWLGTFAAESLILAETGNHVGAVQIAGTDSTIQLAFFLVSCDYTLIGEEVFAASAYLTRDPLVLGGLWAQDFLKVAVWVAVAAGLVGALTGWTVVGDWLSGL
jgi:hypothetical protein